MDDLLAPSTADPAKLATIKALIAKAEATEFGPEADAFLGKATELMARFGLTRGDLANLDWDASEIICEHFPVSGKFAKQRIVMFGWIGYSYGCVSARRNNRLTNELTLIIFGRRDAVQAAERTFRLADMQLAAFLRTVEGKHRAAAIYGFALVVRERITAVNKAADDTTGGTLLPALLNDMERAKAAQQDELGKLRTHSSPHANSAGLAVGRAAGERADLGGHRLAGRRALGR